MPDEEFNGGELGISVKYNGKDLYGNKWDFCTIDEDEEEEDRQVFCPYKPGFHAWVTDRAVPKYLPKVSTGHSKVTDRKLRSRKYKCICISLSNVINLGIGR